MFFFTQHAVDRFRERWAAGLSYGHALRELKVLAISARRLKTRTRNGQEQWEASDDSRLIFVVKRDGPSKGLVCVTILPEPEEPESAETDPGA